jgi:hypothetical protein
MSSFEDIRPYEDAEVTNVVGRLLRDAELLRFLSKWQAPGVHRYLPWPVEKFVAHRLGRQLHGVNSIKGIQEIVAQAVQRLLKETATSFRCEGVEKLDQDESYLFISNHRDIAGDSMLLNYALHRSDYETARIAVGDNLIQRPFATDLMKLNKSFFIKRSGKDKRSVYKALAHASEYIQNSLREGSSIWIAQSEGRAKDGIDRTDPAVIKMLTLHDRKRDFAEHIASLKIVPMSLAYEFDPCDEMKARELTSIAQTGEYQKTEGEDLLSLARGLAGFKGNIILRLGDVLDTSFSTAEDVALEVDRQVLANLKLFPISYWALSQIKEDQYQSIWDQVRDQATTGDPAAYESRQQDCDVAYRAQWLKTYANPVVNKFSMS